MKTSTIAQPSSDPGVTSAPNTSKGERGIALIVVLLLLAVLSGLATGFAMTGNVEVQMGTNEVYFAGARAAAEAGLNRAIVEIIGDTTHNFLAGADNDINTAADNGKLDWVLGGPGPYVLDAAGQYTYEIEILDDDNDSLYETPLSAAQVTQMGEDDNILSNTNDRLIVRAIGHGPNGTVVRIARVLETVDTTTITQTNVPSMTDAAIVVDGDFEMNGGVTITGTPPQWGSVHANGNLEKTGMGGTISGNATCTGTYSGQEMANGVTGGGRPTITVPDIHASDYLLPNSTTVPDFKLTSTGGVQTKVGGVWTNCTSNACKNIDWSFDGGTGTWSTGKNPTGGIYYVEGKVSIGPTQGNSNKPVSIIATGDIDVQSNQAKLTPATGTSIQFVTDGDLTINASDLDLDAVNLDGQIYVRGQMDAGGNMSFQGRVMVKNVAGAGTAVADNESRIHGSVQFTYNGSLGDLNTTTPVFTPGVTTYVNNVSGWMEQ